MLYVSTRNRMDSYTAYRALHEDLAPDGGMFLPFRLPQLSEEEIRLFRSRSFGDNIAEILNLFFSAKLTGWDVEFCCGRYPIKHVDLTRRLIVVESWHNTAASYAYMEQALNSRLCGDANKKHISSWAQIAINIAYLFAVWGSCQFTDVDQPLDIAVDATSSAAPIAAWYARKMGLPIGTVICGSVGSSAAWDLIHRGELSGSVPAGERRALEQLVYATLGRSEAEKFAVAGTQNRPYLIPEDNLNTLNEGISVAVVSKDRIASVISSFYRSNRYVLDTSAAVAFAALQDHRARIGESNQTIISSMINPAKHMRGIGEMLGLSTEELEKVVNQQRG